MQVIEEDLVKIVPKKDTLLTIGVFDGVHLGHQHLLTHLRNKAREEGWLSGVVTFKSHPQTVLHPRRKLLLLSDLETRVNLLHSLGIDIVATLDFNPELAQLSARAFLQLLKDYLKMQGLVIGPDFALGRNRQGSAEQLRLLGQEMGFSIEIMTPFVLNGEVVSSSTIRQALTQGNTKKVENLMGRPFSLSAQVISGDQRGRTLGFPTANLDIKPEQALPSDGVYATIAHIDHNLLPSVTNVGTRPTFGGGNRTVETHLLDYEGQLKGQRLTIDLVDKLRGERHFDRPEELKAQIAKDIAKARAILDK